MGGNDNQGEQEEGVILKQIAFIAMMIFAAGLLAAVSWFGYEKAKVSRLKRARVFDDNDVNALLNSGKTAGNPMYSNKALKTKPALSPFVPQLANNEV